MSTDEKAPQDVLSSAASGGSSDRQHAASPETQVDAAWDFLNAHRDAGADAVSTVNLNALRRKIDFRIVPLMFGCYTMQFLDKVILNARSTFPPVF